MLSPQLADEVFEVVIELTVITDIAARARFTMAPYVGGHDREVVLRQALGDLVHANRMTGRAVDDDCNVLRVAVSGWIEPIGLRRAIAGLEARNIRSTRLIDRQGSSADSTGAGGETGKARSAATTRVPNPRRIRVHSS